MKQIKGQLFLTVHAAANEVYELDYAAPPRLNIMNNTEGDAFIGTDSAFAEADNAGLYIKLPSGAAANNIAMPFKKVCIKAAAAGDIVIERCG